MAQKGYGFRDEISLCRESGVLRMFKLSSGTADDYAYLFAADYADLVRILLPL